MALSALVVEVGEAEGVCVLHQLLRKVVELPRSHACMQHGHTCQPLNAHDFSSIHMVVYTCTAPSGTMHNMPFNTHGMNCGRARPLTKKSQSQVEPHRAAHKAEGMSSKQGQNCARLHDEHRSLLPQGHLQKSAFPCKVLSNLLYHARAFTAHLYPESTGLESGQGLRCVRSKGRLLGQGRMQQ